VAAQPRGGEKVLRHYEVMVILDPSLEERTVAPSLDQYLNVIRTSGGSVEKLDVWGRRRLAFEIKKKAEGIYAVIDLQATPAAVAELDRQLSSTSPCCAPRSSVRTSADVPAFHPGLPSRSLSDPCGNLGRHDEGSRSRSWLEKPPSRSSAT
jgi:small subunit ribosomal protein S6